MGGRGGCEKEGTGVKSGAGLEGEVQKGVKQNHYVKEISLEKIKIYIMWQLPEMWNTFRFLYK